MTAIETHLIIHSIVIAVSWAVAAVLQKDILTFTNPNTLLAINYTIGLLSLLLITLFKNDFIDFVPPNVPYYRYIQIIAFVWLNSVLPNVLLYSLIQSNDVNRVTALASTYPLFTLILAWIILKERINIYSVVGILLIVSGSFVIVMYTSNTERPKDDTHANITMNTLDGIRTFDTSNYTLGGIRTFDTSNFMKLN